MNTNKRQDGYILFIILFNYTHKYTCNLFEFELIQTGPFKTAVIIFTVSFLTSQTAMGYTT